MTKNEYIEKLKALKERVLKAAGTTDMVEKRDIVMDTRKFCVDRADTIKEEIMDIVAPNNCVSSIEMPSIVFALETVTAFVKEEMNKLPVLTEMYEDIKERVEVEGIAIPYDKRSEGK